MIKTIRHSLLCALSLSSIVIFANPETTQKEWNFSTYMSNNNNLHRFGIKNMHQMTAAGSTPSMNILLQMDVFGEKEIIRFLIERNNPMIMDTQSGTNTSYSGTPENLFDFARWAITNYPAQQHAFVLWNHGAGIKDPHIWGRIMKWRDELFVLNQETGKLDLNRATPSLHERGIAFNDAAEAYLTNEDLKNSLEKISQELLGGNKIEILAMDACNMAMIEVASQIKNAVKIMVASEEVEPGSGYDYAPVLKTFEQDGVSAHTVAKQMVASYENQYKNSIGDYTQSAVDLSYINDLEASITKVSSLLIGLLSQGNRQTMKAIRNIRTNGSLTTEFYDNDYIDLYHFLKSLAIKGDEYATDNQKWFSFFSNEKKEIQPYWATIRDAALEAMAILDNMIIANAAGLNLPEARGLAIYFPQRVIHSSYANTEFAKATTWSQFLQAYMNSTRTRGLDAHDHEHKGETKEPCCQDCAEKGMSCTEVKTIKTVEAVKAIATPVEPVIKAPQVKVKKVCIPCNAKKNRRARKA